MLFNSHVFILVFLPLCWVGFVVAGRWLGERPARAWLVAASLFFYGWWNPRYLALILASVAVNYAVGLALAARAERGAPRGGLLALGVAVNLGALAYFKYANFFVDTLAALGVWELRLQTIVLPLAISFFTFQQIAYLVDAWREGRAERDLLHYTLFVTFFPQLIAGPIVHHREMLPQFEALQAGRPKRRHLEVGCTIFFAGLFKKVVIADGVAAWSTPVFESVALGALPGAAESWTAALAYTFQLYFDFSGYSDMAVGLGLLFGVRLPLNFASPYRATSIIDFWRRWHMTLSRFLKEQLYIPLGGNRHGSVRRYVNLMITMVLGGLWHGAGFTFLAWGALHGFYLLVNHAWRALRGDEPGAKETGEGGAFGRLAGRVLTFVAVVFGWVLFRAEHFGDAVVLYEGMLGLRGVGGLSGGLVEVGVLAALTVFCMAAPNLHEWMGAEEGALAPPGALRETPARLRWRPTPAFAGAMAMVAAAAVLGIQRYSEFLYFQF